MIVVPNTKRMKNIMRIQVCLIWKMNFDYMLNGGEKSFSCQAKAPISCTQWGQRDFSAQSQKNEYYYENPSLSYLKDELWL